MNEYPMREGSINQRPINKYQGESTGRETYAPGALNPSSPTCRLDPLPERSEKKKIDVKNLYRGH